MTLDSLRIDAAVRRAKGVNHTLAVQAYRERMQEAEAALDEALALIGKLVVAGDLVVRGERYVKIMDGRGRAKDFRNSLAGLRALLAEMGDS